MKPAVNRFFIFILFIIIKNSGFSQVSSFSATPQTLTNCSACSGDAWTITPNLCLSFSNVGYTKDLNLTNMGFNIPADAVIKGITVAISSFSCIPEEYYDSDVKLLINNVASGSNKATLNNFLPYPSYNNTLYGDTNDVWGNVLTPSIVNDINFGVTLKFTHSVASPYSCFQVNGPFSGTWPFTFYPVMTIYYSAASTNTNTATGLIESQASISKMIDAYSFEGNMYVTNTSSELIENAKMTIYNGLGEAIYTEEKTIAPKEVESLMLHAPAAGFYIFTLASSKNELIYSKKIFLNPR